METQSNQCSTRAFCKTSRIQNMMQKQQNSRIQKSNHGTKETLINDTFRGFRFYRPGQKSKN